MIRALSPLVSSQPKKSIFDVCEIGRRPLSIDVYDSVELPPRIEGVSPPFSQRHGKGKARDGYKIKTANVEASSPEAAESTSSLDDVITRENQDAWM